MSRRIVVGGGIGAGKSSVLELLSDAGFEVIETDRMGHAVLRDDPAVLSAVTERWPSVVVDGEVSRPALAAIVFADDAELRVLEDITHPAIRARIATAIDSFVADGGDPDIALEVPVMRLMDESWVRIAVVAPVELRVARAVARGADADDVRARILAQPTDEEWIAWSDHVIDNSGDREDVAEAVANLVRDIA